MLDKAINILKNSQFISLHTFSDRENEVDILDANGVLHHSKIYV